MTFEEKMEEYARECVRLAQVADDHQLRERLLQMALEWMAAAMREEKRPRNRSRRSSNGMRQNT